MGRRRKVSVSVACARALADEPTLTLMGENDPTPERLMQAGCRVAIQLGTGRVQIVGPARDRPIGGDLVVRLAQAPLDRLFARDRLDEADPNRNRQLFEAGEKLRNHHYLAGLSGFASNDLNGSGGGTPSNRLPITETMERNRRALRIAASELDAGDWAVVDDVVCREATLQEAGRKIGFGSDDAAAAVALDRLRRGLGGLAQLWGYSPPERPGPTPAQAANDPLPAADAA